MEKVQTANTTKPRMKPQTFRDAMNNEVSSTSSEDNSPTDPTTPIHGTLTKYFNKNYVESTASDNEIDATRRKCSTNIMQSRTHHRSMGNINDSLSNDVERHLQRVQNSISNVDLSRSMKKYESLQIPIVGYEVMEERARFTIYKLKVEDDSRDQSWLVFRRYTDFVRLYSRIKSEMPDLQLPLPGKRWFRDNFDPQFLDERVRGLQIFVNAILQKLPEHPVVREFFCLDEPPQVFSYQPEVQAVYGALEDSVTSLKMQLKQKDVSIVHLQKRLAVLESQVTNCSNCSTKLGLKSS